MRSSPVRPGRLWPDSAPHWVVSTRTAGPRDGWPWPRNPGLDPELFFCHKLCPSNWSSPFLLFFSRRAVDGCCATSNREVCLPPNAAPGLHPKLIFCPFFIVPFWSWPYLSFSSILLSRDKVGASSCENGIDERERRGKPRLTQEGDRGRGSGPDRAAPPSHAGRPGRQRHFVPGVVCCRSCSRASRSTTFLRLSCLVVGVFSIFLISEGSRRILGRPAARPRGIFGPGGGLGTLSWSY